MNDNEKVVAYEMHIEDMLNALIERLAEFEGMNELELFQQGRQLAYIEMMGIIRTRHSLILELLEDSEDDENRR